jgi:hypothetical protein
MLLAGDRPQQTLQRTIGFRRMTMPEPLHFVFNSKRGDKPAMRSLLTVSALIGNGDSTRARSSGAPANRTGGRRRHRDRSSLHVTDDHLQFAVAVFAAKVGFCLRRDRLRLGLQKLLMTPTKRTTQRSAPASCGT